MVSLPRLVLQLIESLVSGTGGGVLLRGHVPQAPLPNFTAWVVGLQLGTQVPTDNPSWWSFHKMFLAKCNL